MNVKIRAKDISLNDNLRAHIEIAVEEFKKYQKASRAFVKNSKIRGDDFSSVLTGLYNNPSHFIYEILQNAEDAGAKEIGFELFEDRLDIYTSFALNSNPC